MKWVQTFEATLESPARARDFVTSITNRIDDARIEDTARLLVSELVTNAVIHSAATFTLQVALGNGPFHVEVCDNRPSAMGGAHPVPEANAFSGHGRNVVEALADRWGVEPTGHGVSVWFELESLPTAPVSTPAT